MLTEDDFFDYFVAERFVDAGAQVERVSSEPRVVTIDANGKVRGMAPGTTVLRATCGDKSAELTLTVALKAPKVGNKI